MRFTFLFVVLLAIVTAGCANEAGEGPMVVVTASYPGAGAQTVADTIAAPIEQQIFGVESMVRLYSESRNDGSYVAYAQFKRNVDEERARTLVKNRIGLVRDILPDVAKGGLAIRLQAASRDEKLVAVVLVDGRDMGLKALRRFSDAVVKRFSVERAIRNPKVFPGPDQKQIYLNIDHTKCSRLGITIANVYDAMQAASNGKKPELQTGTMRPVSADVQKDIDTLKKVTVRSQEGKDIPLSALAEFTIVDAPAVVYRVNMYTAVRITGSPEEGKTVKEAAARCVELADAERRSREDSLGFTVINLTSW